MPFKSKAQQRFMFAAESQGKLKPGTARKWAHETKNMKKLPEHVKKAAFEAALFDELVKTAIMSNVPFNSTPPPVSRNPSAKRPIPISSKGTAWYLKDKLSKGNVHTVHGIFDKPKSFDFKNRISGI